MSILLGITVIYLGLEYLFSDQPADLKIWLGLIPIFVGVMLLLGYK